MCAGGKELEARCKFLLDLVFFLVHPFRSFQRAVMPYISGNNSSKTG